MTTSVDTTDPDPRRSQSSDNRDAEDFPEAVVDAAVEFLGKPRLRGWIHVYAAVIAAIAGAALVSVSWSVESTRAGIATLIYTLTIVAMFTVSGTYHRVNWTSPTARKWMKRLDHSMIFIFIAGSYTPFALLALPERSGWILFWIVVGRRARRGAAEDVLAVGAALGGRPALPAAGLGGGVVHRADHERRRDRRHGAADRRRRAVQRRRRALRAEVAQPVADDVRPPRVLPRLHRGRGDLPLHRDVVRRLLVVPACKAPSVDVTAYSLRACW